MLEGQVVGFILGVQGNLPIGILLNFIRMGQAALMKGGPFELFSHATQVVGERLLGLWAQMHEDKPFPHIYGHRGESQLALIGDRGNSLRPERR